MEGEGKEGSACGVDSGWRARKMKGGREGEREEVRQMLLVSHGYRYVCVCVCVCVRA